MGFFKRLLKIIGIIFLVSVLLIAYIGFNFYHNITDKGKINLYNCQKPPLKDYLGTFDCIYSKFIECSPATSETGIVIVGERNDKCLVLLETVEAKDIDVTSLNELQTGTMGTAQYKCYFPYSYISSFKSIEDYNDAEEKMTDLLLNLKSNEYCNKLSTLSVFFTRIMD